MNSGWRLTSQERRDLRRLFRGHLPIEEAANDMGMSIGEVREAWLILGLGERKEPEVYMPTSSDIAEAAELIRSRWTDRERRRRCVRDAGI